MKRRNVELSKLRRPMKSKRISEGSYSSVFGYMKFLAVWGLVLLADFIMEFRFEYLYPVWLLYRTVQDSYKYQGVLLTMLFLALVVGTDIMCYVFITVQWLFFAASSYVWVQYVWHTDRGICLSSISLWLLFVYVEAALRMRDQKSLPYNVNLCRPFAAHCIGYPVVTLGYGIKTAASESLRRRTRDKVRKTNQYCMQILQDALPPELRVMNETPPQSDLKSDLDKLKEDTSDTSSETSESCTTSSVKGDSSHTSNGSIAVSTPPSHHHNHQHNNTSSNTRDLHTHNQQHSNASTKASLIEDYDIQNASDSRDLRKRNINDLSEEAENLINDSKSKVSKDPVPKKLNNKRNKGQNNQQAVSTSTSSSPATQSQPQQQQSNNISSNTTTTTNPSNGHVVNANGDIGSPQKTEFVTRLESDIKRLKADLQSSRNTESELRAQLNNKSTEERELSATLSQLQQDNDTLQNKLHNLVMSKQQDKQNLAQMEKKYLDEKKLRERSEQQLQTEKKSKKQEEQVAAKALALASVKNTDCIGNCKTKLKDLEDGISKLKWDAERKEEQLKQLESDAAKLRNYKETNTDKNEVLMSALAAMQDKMGHLENSLSAETKIKMELFSALGEVRRQMEIQRRMLSAKDAEIASLRSHITEALALVPSSMYSDQPLATGQYTTPKLGSPTIVNCGQPYIGPPHDMMYQHYAAMTPPPAPIAAISQRYSPPAHQNMTSNTSSPSVTPVSDVDNTAVSGQDYQQSQSN